MNEAKKFFWLKLDKDFFKRHDIRIIEGMDNGKDYVLFYMKLLLESVSHEGTLRFSNTVPYNEKMLATITNTNIDVVKQAVKIFTELNMMEFLDDGTIFMKETQKMLGSESKWAEYKRKDKKEIGNFPTQSKKSPIEIEKEKELELEKDIELDKEIKDFDQFWKAYPKKEGKGQAEKAWSKASKSKDFPKLDFILSAIERYKQTDTVQKGFIKNASTWINGKCWLDEFTTQPNCWKDEVIDAKLED